MDLQAWVEGAGVPWPLAAVIGYATMNGIAVLLYMFFENPVRKALRLRFA